MNFLEAVIIGIVQGITEFIPISSSAHIILTQRILGTTITGGLTFEVFLHFASILAVIYFFRNDLYTLISEFFFYLTKKDPKYKPSFYFCLYIVVATFITGVLGITLEKLMGDSLKSMTTISVSLFITGTFLLLIEKVIKYGDRPQEKMTFKDAILIGLGQTVAVIPGISRAGSTLVVALWTGLEKETAVRFSFLLSIPVILGSSILMIPDISMTELETSLSALVASFIASFVFAVLGIKWLLAFLKQSRLSWFAYYCYAVSIIIFFFFR